MNHEMFEKNSIMLLVGILVVVVDRRHRADRPAVLGREHDREGQGHAALLPPRAGRPRHLPARGLLRLPQPDDPHAPRRGRALRPLQPRRREHVRPSLPVGLQAHRAGPRPRRRQVLRPMAGRAHDEPALGRAGEHHAGLSLARREELDTHDIAAQAQDAEARRRPLQRRDDREGRQDVDAQINPDSRRRGSCCAAIPRPRSRNSTASPAPSPPSSMRSSPTCKCSARWSTSPASMPAVPICAEKGCHHDL